VQKLTVKQQKFADEYIISGNATQAALNAKHLRNGFDEIFEIMSIRDPLKRRIVAADHLLKRFGTKITIADEDIVDSVAVIISKEASANQKLAAKIILKYTIGSRKANDIVEAVAVVKDRSDALVSRWHKKVLERDKYTCQHCGSQTDLAAHHISYWANDPVNRINVDNGITLCRKCHTKEHVGEPVHNLIAGTNIEGGCLRSVEVNGETVEIYRIIHC